jgi:hypothetical protein
MEIGNMKGEEGGKWKQKSNTVVWQDSIHTHKTEQGEGDK